jgi:transposase
MTKLTKCVDFSGHKIYIGIDVHLKSWQVAIYCEGRLLKNYTQPPGVTPLVSFLQENYPNGTYVFAYESGFSGNWIQRSLADLGYECLVVNAADIPQTDKGEKNKTDKMDAKRIGQSLQAGFLQSIFIPSEELEADRQLVRSYSRYTMDLTKAKNRIKGLLYYVGIQVPKEFEGSAWSKGFLQWLKALNLANTSIQKVLSYQLENLEYLRAKKSQLLKEITELTVQEKYVETAICIKSVPGVGIITAATLLTEVGDMGRFENHKQLNSFVGLYPTSHSSGPRERQGSMTGRHNRHLRVLLIEAAWRAIAVDPAMTTYYAGLKGKIGGKRAIVKVAAKLLNRIRYVWINKKKYEIGIVE